MEYLTKEIVLLSGIFIHYGFSFIFLKKGGMFK